MLLLASSVFGAIVAAILAQSIGAGVIAGSVLAGLFAVANNILED